METKEGKFSAKDGFSIFWKAFLPDGKPKAVVHTIHGYAEHIDRYKNVIDEIVPAGYAVIGNDHRGHGRSDVNGNSLRKWSSPCSRTSPISCWAIPWGA
jgi:acylglycerol lipase